jgi:serine/threonine-protein kinase
LLNFTSARTATSHKERQVGRVSPTRATPAGARFIPGREIAGRYRIVSLLGKGGMGEVYRADDLKLGQPVALKFLPPALEANPDRLARLLNEVRLARQVSHLNVCRVYDVSDVDGRHFLSMEYVDGENLASLLKRIGRLPGDKAVELARQICSGLSAAHSEGILHRDLKPANVMIDGRGRARITDFGLAALPGEIGSEDLTAGTPAYMAPEQLAGTAVSVQSDIYSLGLVLYELFTGRMAFPAASRDEMARLRAESAPTRPSDHVEGLDPAVERVLLQCLAANPSDRPRSAQAVSAALPGGDPLAAAIAAGETPSPEMVAAAGRAEAMTPWRAITLAVVAVALFTAGVSMLGRQQLRAYLPAVKQPAVMVDRAREIIARLSYAETAYAAPADMAYGYDVREWPLEKIRETDRSSDRWHRLRDPESQVLSFWYRQSPRPLLARMEDGRVTRWEPFPRKTGEVLVSLEPDGRLNQFVAVPRRFARSPSSTSPYDWSIPFSLAGLDMAAFRPVEPRYQRYMHHDQRGAWEPLDPSMRYRIETGANEGRLSLFVKLDEGEVKDLAAEPEEFRETIPFDASGFWLGALVVGAAIARRNVRRGRADMRTAVRLAVFFGAVVLLAYALRIHDLFAAGRLLWIADEAVSSGLFAMVLYLALEPTARATWPSMLVSWTRLIGRARPGWRDPIVGRALLGGLVAGAFLLLLASSAVRLMALWDGVPPPPPRGNWSALLSQRDAWAVIVERVGWSVVETLILPFLLVLGRLLLRRTVPAILAGGAVWIAPDILGALADREGKSTADIVIGLLLLGVVLMVLILVVLRWGLVGLYGASIVSLLGHQVAPTPDWNAWHAQPSILCLIVVGALAAYGCWAATGGWSLVGRSLALPAAPPSVA